MKVARVIYKNPKMSLRHESYEIITDNIFYNLRLILQKENNKIHIFNKLKKSEIRDFSFDVIKNIDCNLFNNIKYPLSWDSWEGYTDLNGDLDNSTKRLYFEIIKHKYNENI